MTHHDYTRALEDLKALDACDSYNRSGYLEDFYHEHLETIQNALEAMVAPQGDLEKRLAEAQAQIAREVAEKFWAKKALEDHLVASAHLHPRKPDVSEIVDDDVVIARGAINCHVKICESLFDQIFDKESSAWRVLEAARLYAAQSGQTAQDADVEAIEKMIRKYGYNYQSDYAHGWNDAATEALAIVQRMKKAGR